jgi:hypothetical protein
MTKKPPLSETGISFCSVAAAGVGSPLPLRLVIGSKQKFGRLDFQPPSPLRWSEDVSDVVSATSGADVAGEHALVLMTGRRGDLSWVVAVASGLGRVPSAE